MWPEVQCDGADTDNTILDEMKFIEVGAKETSWEKIGAVIQNYTCISLRTTFIEFIAKFHNSRAAKEINIHKICDVSMLNKYKSQPPCHYLLENWEFPSFFVRDFSKSSLYSFLSLFTIFLL